MLSLQNVNRCLKSKSNIYFINTKSLTSILIEQTCIYNSCIRVEERIRVFLVNFGITIKNKGCVNYIECVNVTS